MIFAFFRKIIKNQRDNRNHRSKLLFEDFVDVVFSTISDKCAHSLLNNAGLVLIVISIFYKNKSKPRLETLDEKLAKSKDTLKKTNQLWYFRCRFFGAANFRHFVINVRETCFKNFKIKLCLQPNVKI